MTNKEAINFLNQVRKILLDDKSWLESTIQPINEAFDMAIKALEQPEPCKDDKGCSNCMYSGRPTYKSPCSECRNNSQWEMKPISRSHENSTECEDTISRQEAIDALKGLPTWWADEGGFYGGAQPPMTALLDPEDAVSAIVNLPPAQPEPPEDICGECDAWNKYKSENKTGRWIPVSERLPEDGENCLVSVRCSNNFLVDRGTYSTDLFNVDEEDFFGNRGESGWYYLSSEYGYCKIMNVIAWMPEPRPYKEIKDEGFN